MAERTTSERQERAAISARLRSEGKTWGEIAQEFHSRYRVNARVAMRYAHGLSQKEVADEWNLRWPNEPRTLKNVSSWELWPSKSGHQPSLVVLGRLAEIYECSVADLVTDCADYRHLDQANKENSGDSPSLLMPGPVFRKAILGELADALFPTESRRYIPTPSVELLKKRSVEAWRYRQSADYYKLGNLLVNSLHDTEMALSHNKRKDSTYDLTASYVHIHNAASSLLKSLCASELASVAADRALQAAIKSGENLLIGSATLRVANVFLAADCYSEALRTAENGTNSLLSHLDNGSDFVATWGALLLTGALAAAKLVDDIHAFELLGQAKIASDLLKEDHAGLHAVFGPANLAIHRVQIATELDRPKEGLRRFKEIDISKLPQELAERQTTLLLDIARCHYSLGDHESALEKLKSADRIAPQEVQYSPAARALSVDLLTTRKGNDSDLISLATRMGVTD